MRVKVTLYHYKHYNNNIISECELTRIVRQKLNVYNDNN